MEPLKYQSGINHKDELCHQSPRRKISISVRVTPYIHNQLYRIATANGVKVSVVIRAFILHGIERVEENDLKDNF